MFRRHAAARVLGAIALFSVIGLAGCGQKGPLYLPKDTPAATKPAQPVPVDKDRNKDKKNDSDSPTTPPPR